MSPKPVSGSGKIFLVFLIALLMLSLALIVRNHFYQWYDPDMNLQKMLYQNLVYKPNTMVVYTSLDCPCNIISSEHLSELRVAHEGRVQQEVWLPKMEDYTQRRSDLAKSFGVNEHQLFEISDKFQHKIIKAPTILLFDNNAELVYLGPVSTGLSCNNDTSLIDVLLDKISSGFPVSAGVNSIVKGCFCDI